MNMSYFDKVEILRDAWEAAEKTIYEHLTSQEKRSIELLIDFLEDIGNNVIK